MNASSIDLGMEARRLIRRRDHAAFGTTLSDRPYVSLVAVACDGDASPLLLLSDLAQHSKNLHAEPRVSLLFEDTAGLADPLAGPRLTLLGRAALADDARLAARFQARHPASAAYAGFADFHLYRVTIERGHLVAGFGRINWIEGNELTFGTSASGLVAAEAEIIAHMNRDHAEAIALYAERLLGKPGGAWQMTGIDPEGIDLRCEGAVVRLDFGAPVLSPAAARKTLVELAAKARSVVAPG